MKKRLFFKLVFSLALLFVIPHCAFAVFIISIRPFEGGNDVRFGRVSNFGPYTSKEVTINIDSDIGKQYQLIHVLLDPLSNDQGISLSQNNFTVYGIRGSNQSGTLPVEQEMNVSQGRTIIYTSDASGHADSFKLVYVLKPPFNVPSGFYHGRLAFTLEPIGSPQQPITVIVNISAQIDIESSIEMKTPTGPKIISLSSYGQDRRSYDVLVDIKGEMGSQFKIFQAVTQPLESSEGRRLSTEAVTFQIRGQKKGSGQSTAIPVSSRQDLIYSSGLRGEADSCIITYGLSEPEKQKAGKYRSNMRYTVESATTQNVLGNFELEVEIARVFDLIISPELGGTIQFRNLKLGESPRQSEVLIEVKSNIGTSYQVSQQMLSALVNKEGKTIPAKYFTLREEGVNTKGKLLLSSPAEVKVGQMILFVSDRDGSSDKFKVIYELASSPEVIAGDYSANFTYSISEI